MSEERKIGVLVGLPNKSSTDIDRLGYFLEAADEWGLQFIDRATFFQDPKHPAAVDFLISVVPGFDNMSDLITGYALGTRIPTLILARGAIDPGLEKLPGNLVISLDTMTRYRVSSAIRRFALWMDDEEDKVLMKGARFFRNGALEIDHLNHLVTLDNQQVSLTPIEYRLTDCLARNVDRVMEKDELLEDVWGESYIGEHHILHVHVARTRAKLGENGEDPTFIVTRPGVGYWMPSLIKSSN